AQRTFFYGLSTGGDLVTFTSGGAMQEQGNVIITGLGINEQIIAIDFRPATGQLYGVSNQSRLFTINLKTGIAVAVSPTPFSPAINGTVVGFDFNPTVDRIRLVSENEQNLRLNPKTGTVAATDGSINPGDVRVSAVAYTNSVAGATTTTLYDIDFAAGKLYKQVPPNDGTLQEVGSLGISNKGDGGFDIAWDNSTAIAVASETDGYNNSLIYKINLTTGQATVKGKTSKILLGIAIAPRPVAYAVDIVNQLLIFNPQNVFSMLKKPISGLPRGEKIVGLDSRPVNGQLYALGRTSRLYTINMASGAAAALGTQSFSQTLNGTRFGFDFNPTVDRIRIVSNKGQNLRLHPVTGDIAVVDGGLNPGSPAIDAAAYTNNYPGATTTTLYVIDYLQDKLYTQAPPNNGTLNVVNTLSMNVADSNGFDIGGNSGNAMGIFTIDDNAFLAAIDLVSGQVNIISSFPDNVVGFTLGAGF
nr:DUF4394 domain-containing protein [Bacteroidota bacterium]